MAGSGRAEPGLMNVEANPPARLPHHDSLPADGGAGVLEYVAVVVLVAALTVVLAAGVPWERLPRGVGGAVDRALGGEEGPVPVPVPEGEWTLDPVEAADAVRRCLDGVWVPDPVSRVDCALALLGLLDAPVLERTVLRLEAEELHELFTSGRFSASTVARRVVWTVWEQASERVWERLVHTSTFAFLRPVLEDPRAQYALRFVQVGAQYVRPVLERKAVTLRHTPRTHHARARYLHPSGAPRQNRAPVRVAVLPSARHETGPDHPPRRRPHWLLVAAAVVLCPVVVVVGWSAGHLVTHGLTEDAPDRRDAPPPAAAPPMEEAEPEEAGGFVRSAALRVDAARRFDVTFFVHGAGTDESVGLASFLAGAPDPGHGRATFDAASDPQFEHTFTTFGGTQVFRYGSDGGRCLMATGPGTPQLTAIESPSDADEYLCTRDFASAKLWEILASSADLEYAGEETIELVPQVEEESAERGPGGPERVPAHRYTGTFTTLMGGYDPEAGANVLSPVEETGFELWIDGDGLPRRLVHEDGAGTGETYDYRRVW